jgi:hypothetical protein
MSISTQNYIDPTGRPDACHRGRCQSAQKTPIMIDANRGLIFDCILGIAKPRQPVSSPVALKNRNW